MVYETRPIWLNPSNWLEVQCVVYLSTIKYRVPHVHNRCMSACVRERASVWESINGKKQNLFRKAVRGKRCAKLRLFQRSDT